MVRQDKSIGDAPLQTHVLLLLRLERLMQGGQGDSSEADLLRDIMDVSWNQMTPDEQAITRQLSADLFTLNAESKARHPLDFDAFSQSLARDIGSARDRGDYFRILQMVRERPEEISMERATMLRGMCYEHLGLLDAALMFLDHVTGISRDRDNAIMHLLTKLNFYGRTQEAADRVNRLLSDSPNAAVEFRILAADFEFDLALLQEGQSRDEQLRRAEELYSLALDQIGDDLQRPLRWGSASHCRAKLSASYMLRGQQSLAQNELTAAILLSPTDESLRVQRGLLTNGTDFQSAIMDFREAVRLGTQNFWAFYYLAVDALLSEHFDECIRMAEAARRRTADSELLAKLHEWIAISLASKSTVLDELTIQSVRNHFRIATSLSPSSQRVMENFRVFEARLHDAKPEPWHVAAPVDVLATTQQSVLRGLANPMLVPN